MMIVLVIRLRGKCLCVGYPELSVRVGIGEPAWKYSDDSVWVGVEADGLAENGRVAAEAPLEEVPGKENNVRASGLVFVGSEGASESQLRAKDRKEI